MKTQGQDLNEDKAAHILENIKAAKEKEVKQLDQDELDAVSGGGASLNALRMRNYLEEGCAATVEPGSDCAGTDGGCSFLNIEYYPEVLHQRCTKCGAYLGKWGDKARYPNCDIIYDRVI